MQTLVTKLVNYKSEQGAKGELSCFGDEWMATMQRDMEGEGKRRKRMAKKEEEGVVSWMEVWATSVDCVVAVF